MDTSPERVLVYLGPSLPKAEAERLVPGCTVRPPARSGDVLNDLHALEPTRVLLIDGEFQQHFSTWIKELVYAIQYPGVRGVYGASSLGALRAAELHRLGMAGCGRIFDGYRSGDLDDDAEVAVAYRVSKTGVYRSTVPLVNVRAGGATPDELDKARAIHWSERWPAALRAACPGLVPVDQKRADAIELLQTFRCLKPDGPTRPTPESLTGLFLSQLQRDRRVTVGTGSVPLGRIDAVVALEHPERRRVFWDAANRALALHLADQLHVIPSPEEVHAEGVRHCERFGLCEPGTLEVWLKANGVNGTDFHLLMFENARIARLHRALEGTLLMARKTQGVLDYLRTHNQFEPWALRAALNQADEDAGTPVAGSDAPHPEAVWRQRAAVRGERLDGTFDVFLREHGFYSGAEYLLELDRLPQE